MPRIRLRPILLCLTGLLICSCPKLPDRTALAQVEEEKIRISDLQRKFHEQGDQFDPDLLKDPEGALVVKHQLLNGLIEETLLLREAAKANITLSPEEEKSLEERLRSGYHGGELEAVLNRRKTDWNEWVGQQKKKKIMEKLILSVLDPKIEVTPEEIRGHYRKYPRAYQEPDRVRCRHIVAAKEDKARTILSLLNRGENFAAVAQKYSESPDREHGGDLGFFARGEYPPIFDAACFTLNTGQTSDIVRSDYGYHIFRVTEKDPGHQLSLQEAAPRIEAALREQKRKVALRSWLEELHHNRKIEINEEALKGARLEKETH